MILSDADIKRLLAKNVISIKPRVKREQLGQASIDLTLSGEWWRFKKAAKGKKQDLGKVNAEEVTEKIEKDEITLQPGELILGKTLERIKLPSDIMGKLEGRSRYARMGLAVHVTSALVQPGSDNRQVLEICNLAPFPLVLRKGMRVSQIIFEKMASPTTRPYAKYGRIARRQ